MSTKADVALLRSKAASPLRRVGADQLASSGDSHDICTRLRGTDYRERQLFRVQRGLDRDRCR